MPTLHLLQHLFSSVERGYFPQQGRGFQTVAVAEELVGTDDLKVLDEAAFYAVSPERREAGDFPTKEAFFRLPSGRFAIGRTVNSGTDPLGREGNYLTHHLVITRDDLLHIEANPFVIFDAPGLVAPGMDLTPRALPPLNIDQDSSTSAQHNRPFESLHPDLLANLGIAIIDGGGKTALLIGDESRSRAVLQGLFAILPSEERMKLSFSTHYYESHHLRALFALATVMSPAEIPSRREDYFVFELDMNQCPSLFPTSAYGDWLADNLRSKRWEEIYTVNSVLNRLRSSQERSALSPIHPLTHSPIHLPTGARTCAALWEKAGVKIVPMLVGEARRVSEFLRHVPAPRALADALLETASPSDLCGETPTDEEVTRCLSALQSMATRKIWRAWVERWKGDQVLEAFSSHVRPWWLRWKN